MPILRINSIRKRFALGMVVVITFIMLIFSGVLISYNTRTIEKNLQDQLARLVTFSNKSLGGALWQYNYEYVYDYIESLFLYEDLVFASIANNEQEIGKKVHPDFQTLSLEDFSNSRKFIVAEKIVTYNGQNVGHVLLIVSRNRVVNLIMMTSVLSVILLLIINLAVFGTNILLSKWYLFRPLDKLEKSVRVIADGNLDAFIDVSSQDEIGQLARSFKQMIENLKEITTSRDGLNLEVEERKKVEFVLKGSLKEKEILLKEVHHRVKNNMQIIQSLLNLQSGKIDNQDLKQAIQDSNNRIRSMALIHETLYRSDDFSHLDLGTYFENIVKGLYRTYHDAGKNLEWHIDVGSVQLDMDKSIACGLIVNELVTNALKYAFVDLQQGIIKIYLNQASDNDVILRVSDNGVGMKEDFNWVSLDSLGLRIVGMLSEEQLDGRLDLKNDQGLKATVQFPI